MSAPSYKFINKLQDKRVLIFGGTSGIGFAVAEACIEHGSTVIISGSSSAKLDKTVQRLAKSYPNTSPSQIVTHSCDLSKSDSMESEIQTLFSVVTDGGKTKLNHVVFTAGDALSLPSLSQVTVEEILKRQMVRNVAPIIIAKYLLKYLEKSPDSSYTLTGGVNSTKPAPGWAIAATGGSMNEGLSRGLAVDMAPIRVNLVSPGAIKTELFNGIPEQVIEEYRKATTVQRLGRPEDVAEAYLYLMKDGFVTGSIVESNGGRLLV